MTRNENGLRWSVLAVCLVAGTGCAVESLQPDHAAARALIVATTGEPDVYDPARPPLTPEEIDAVLQDGLGLDEALRLALLNSRRLQAGFMQLGIARADYVQSGLLENPNLGMAFLFPAGDAPTRLIGDLALQVTEIWRLPARQAVAGADMQRGLLELARQAADLSLDTRSAYFEAVAAREGRAQVQAGAALAEQLHAAVRERVQHGVALETEAGLALGVALAADLEAGRAEQREAEALRRLAGLLSLAADLLPVALTDGLPEPPRDPVDRETLVAVARAGRLDLRALGVAIEAAEARVALEHQRAVIDVSAGVGYERPESDDPTDHVLGPTFEVELPVFDRNEAGISRAEFELARLRKLYEAVDAEVASQVRAAADRARLAARAADFTRQRLLPQAERTADLSRQSYELGDTTLLARLEAERWVIQALSRQVETALESALAQVELARAVGAPWPVDSEEG